MRHHHVETCSKCRDTRTALAGNRHENRIALMTFVHIQSMTNGVREMNLRIPMLSRSIQNNSLLVVGS